MPRIASAARDRCLELERVIAGRFSSGSIGLDDAVKLFDELLPLARPASVRAFNQLLTIVSRAKGRGSSTSAPVISLFNRMARTSPNKVSPNLCTYNIIIRSFCSMAAWAARISLSLALASYLRFKKDFEFRVDAINQLLNGLCGVKRMGEAMDVLLRRMPSLAARPIQSHTT